MYEWQDGSPAPGIATKTRKEDAAGKKWLAFEVPEAVEVRIRGRVVESLVAEMTAEMTAEMARAYLGSDKAL